MPIQERTEQREQSTAVPSSNDFAAGAPTRVQYPSCSSGTPRPQRRRLLPALATPLLLALLSLLPSHALARTDWPIVFPAFRNQTGAAKWDWLSVGLPEVARTKLHGTIYMRAFTWEEINHVVSQNPGLSSNYNEISKQLGSDLLVIGSYRITGDTIEVSIRCIDPVTGRPLATFTSLGSIHEPSEAMNGLLLQIAEALRIELPLEDVDRLRRPPTAVVEAFQAHAEGLVVINREDPERSMVSEAKSHFRDAISLDPDYAEPHYRLATLLQHEKDLTGAEKSYRDALRADVDHRDARYRLGLLLIDQDRKSEAMSELEHALKQSPEDPQLQTAMSSIWFDQYQSSFSRVADGLQQAVAADPKNPELRIELGGVYEELSKVIEAAAEYKAVLETDPNHPEAAFKLGMIERNTGTPARAAQLFQRAIKNGTKEKRAHFYLGEMHFIQKDYKVAVQSYKKSIEAEPNHIPGHFELGKAQAAAGNNQDALLAYNRYAQISKTDARPHLAIGKQYLAMGLPKQAMAAFEQSVQTNPKYADGYIAIAELYETQNLTFRAAKSYKEALQVQPDHPRAEELKELIRKYQPAPTGNMK